MTEPADKPAPAPAPALLPADRVSLTQHRITLKGKSLAYTVTCGTLVLKEESEKEGLAEAEKARATVFFVAYVLDKTESAAKRPLTFSFNGGPGSSSVWMHLGLAGPKRVLLDEMGNGHLTDFGIVKLLGENTTLTQSHTVIGTPS